MNNDLYETVLDVWHTGWRTGGKEGHEEMPITDELFGAPIMKAFLADDDIQLIKVASTNILCTWRVQKRFKAKEKS